jgi:uncharacterized protein YuzE
MQSIYIIKKIRYKSSRAVSMTYLYYFIDLVFAIVFIFIRSSSTVCSLESSSSDINIKYDQNNNLVPLEIEHTVNLIKVADRESHRPMLKS